LQDLSSVNFHLWSASSIKGLSVCLHGGSAIAR
jgi:hypothetical protein